MSPIRLARATMVPAGSPGSTTDPADPAATTASDVAGIDPTTIDRVFDGKVIAGQLHDLDATGVAVKQAEAEAKQLAVGDEVTATFKNGVGIPMHVTAIFTTALTGSGSSSYLVSLETFQANAQTELRLGRAPEDP